MNAPIVIITNEAIIITAFSITLIRKLPTDAKKAKIA
jgi:hypothetical protein